MNKLLVFGAGTILILLVSVGCLVYSWRGQPYSNDAAVAQLEKERDAYLNNRQMTSPTELQEIHQTFRNRLQDLSDVQKREFFRRSGPFFIQLARQRIEQFFHLSSADQQKKLDEWIDRQQAWQSQSVRQEELNRNRPATSTEQRSQRMKRMLDTTNPELRASFHKLRRMINQRRREQGLEPLQGLSRRLLH